MANEITDWVTYEDPFIYDGWIIRFSPIAGKIEWRDHFVVNRLPELRKVQIESHIKILMEEYKNKPTEDSVGQSSDAIKGDAFTNVNKNTQP